MMEYVILQKLFCMVYLHVVLFVQQVYRGILSYMKLDMRINIVYTYTCV